MINEKTINFFLNIIFNEQIIHLMRAISMCSSSQAP